MDEKLPTAADEVDDFASRVARPRQHPITFYSITGLWLAIMVGVAVFAVNNWSDQVNLSSSISVSLGQCLIAFQILWLVASVKMLRIDELGGVMFYGWAMVRVKRGPKLIIFGIFQIDRYSGAVNHNQHPAEPELIQKTADEVPLEMIGVIQPDGSVLQRKKVRPLRITTSGPKAELGESDILNVQMTVEFTFWVRWVIVDPFEFSINAGGDIDSAVEQMRDQGESLLNREVTLLTPSELISSFKKLDSDLKKAITEAVESWGIKVVGVGLTAPDLNHEVAKSLRDIPVAKAVAVMTRTTADADEYKLSKEGKGRGKAREEELAGEGRGYKRAAKAIGTTAENVLTAQVARDTVGQGDLILGADGIALALGFAKKILQPDPKTPPSAPTSTDGD